MVRTILIIGGSGFLGTHLAARLRDGYKVFATYNNHPVRIPGVTTLPLRFDSPSMGKQTVSVARPDIIVFAAGSANPEWTERNARDAERIHTGGTGAVFTTSGGQPPRLIYLSTAMVFDGNRGNYRETDSALPSTLLGRLRLSGENFVRTKSVNHLILRLNQVLGRGNGYHLGLLDELRIRLGRGERFSLPENELHAFVPIWTVVDAVVRLIDSGPKNRTFHLGGLNKLSPFELGQRFARRFGYDPDLITPSISKIDRKGTDEGSGKVHDFSLNSSQIMDSLKIKPLLLEESFDLIEKKLVSAL